MELIRTAAEKTAGKNGKMLPPVLMSLITSANKKGIRFTSEEIGLILELLKEGKPREEQEQIDKTVQMVNAMKNKYTK